MAVTVTTLRLGYTARRRLTLELAVETRVCLTVELVATVRALSDTVTDLSGRNAVLSTLGVGTLKEAGLQAVVRRTRARFVTPIPAVVLPVTFPPEWNALVRRVAQKLRTGTVGVAGQFVLRQVMLLGAGTHAIVASVLYQTQRTTAAASVVFARIHLVFFQGHLLAKRMEYLNVHRTVCDLDEFLPVSGFVL